MADIERRVVVDDRSSNAGVWIVVVILLLVILALLFIWPGWLMSGNSDADIINIEQQDDPNGQDTQNTDVDVTVPEGSEDTTP